MATLQLTVDGTAVSVQWEENAAVAALRELAQPQPLTIQTSAYGGFEQVGSLGTSLPRQDVATTTAAGDIVLYNGSNLVLFYGANSWDYTRLGRIDGLTAEELRALLDRAAVTVTLTVVE